MSRNIKEIGKELMGKSLNSFHRKTGLTQLEENNKMQDGILDGILSQVDDAYIEKTEQSNVIHLDGSGDGVVVLDSIEGNTMVNCSKTFKGYTLIPNSNPTYHNRVNAPASSFVYKPSTVYTFIINIKENTLTGFERIVPIDGYNTLYVGNFPTIGQGQTGIYKLKVTTREDISTGLGFQSLVYSHNGDEIGGKLVVEDILLLEGDWTNRELPTSYFEGLQSSFEEKVNDEGKYEIEILSNNKNLYNVEDVNVDSWMNSGGATISKVNDNIVLNGTITNYFDFRTVQSSWNANLTKLINKLPVGTTLTMSNNLTSEKNTINYWSVRRDGAIKYFTNTLTIQKGDTEIGGFVRFQNGTVLNNTILKVQIEVNNKATSYTISKQNKIKLLLDEPLRSIDNIKDELCIKDGRLVIERKCRQWTLDGSENWTAFITNANNVQPNIAFAQIMLTDNKTNGCISNIKASKDDLWGNSNHLSETISVKQYGGSDRKMQVITPTSNLQTQNLNGFKNYLNKRCVEGNPIKVIYELEQPVYEEVLNEYGEPILLEGYENGTIYIDSTIVPTTTVRYTPKMESFKTLNEVNNNNIMLTNDVNDNIIPYMMDVDLMIMEKEMALMSQYKIRRIGAKDMTSMQKRTQDMLTRLIKGKTLTEQECKTRVVTYLDAGKITDAQADELMLLISEVYA